MKFLWLPSFFSAVWELFECSFGFHIQWYFAVIALSPRVEQSFLSSNSFCSLLEDSADPRGQCPHWHSFHLILDYKKSPWNVHTDTYLILDYKESPCFLLCKNLRFCRSEKSCILVNVVWDKWQLVPLAHFRKAFWNKRKLSFGQEQVDTAQHLVPGLN